MDYPHFVFPPFNVITPFSAESLGLHLKVQQRQLLGAAASGTFTANQALYFPFRLFEPATAVKMSYLVGATANGNADLGIYDAEKNRLINSGSQGQGTINTVQEIDITDTVLRPGKYYMAIQLSSGTGTWFRTTNSDELILSQMPIYEQAVGSFGLPTTATFTVSTNAAPAVVAMGVHFDATI